MRIVRYERDWKGHYGVVEGDAIYELVGDVFGQARPGARVGRWGEVKLLAPCLPRTIWSNGENYPSRCRERGDTPSAVPRVLWCPGTMICGPEAEIRLPEFETRCEYGAELGIVVRKECRNVEEADADEYILGYTALNNVWAKDPDDRRPQRVYDTCCPVGPVVDTELDWRDLYIRYYANGVLLQDDRTSSMQISPQKLVSFISKLVPMAQGDLIMTGTPGGVQGHVMHYGETVEVDIEGLGKLRNYVTRVDTATPTTILKVEEWRARAGNEEGQ